MVVGSNEFEILFFKLVNLIFLNNFILFLLVLNIYCFFVVVELPFYNKGIFFFKVIQWLLEEKLCALQCAVFDKTLAELKTRVEKIECNKRHKAVLSELQVCTLRLTLTHVSLYNLFSDYVLPFSCI